MLTSNFLKIVDEVFQDINSELSNDDLLTLQSLYGEELLSRALDLIDRAQFIMYKTSTPICRRLIQIEIRNLTYNLYFNVNFCFCSSFKFQVLNNNEFHTCKHLLAARLAYKMNKFAIQEVSAEEMSDLLNISMNVDKIS